MKKIRGLSAWITAAALVVGLSQAGVASGAVASGAGAATSSTTVGSGTLTFVPNSGGVGVAHPLDSGLQCSLDVCVRAYGSGLAVPRVYGSGDTVGNYLTCADMVVTLNGVEKYRSNVQCGVNGVFIGNWYTGGYVPAGKLCLRFADPDLFLPSIPGEPCVTIHS